MLSTELERGLSDSLDEGPHRALRCPHRDPRHVVESEEKSKPKTVGLVIVAIDVFDGCVADHVVEGRCRHLGLMERTPEWVGLERFVESDSDEEFTLFVYDVNARDLNHGTSFLKRKYHIIYINVKYMETIYRRHSEKIKVETFIFSLVCRYKK